MPFPHKALFLILLLFSTKLWANDPLTLEEPGFAFITNNPYTEKKQFMELGLADFFFNDEEAGSLQRNFSNALQISYGFTDRLEATFNLQYDLQWDEASSASAFNHGFNDTMLGLRYRFLTENDNPITLAFGPQLLLPTGNLNNGFGLGGLSLAWDLTLAKEWKPWFFHFVELNYSTTFSAVDPTNVDLERFTLHNFFWAVCLGFRPLEIDNDKGGHHDIHFTLEFGGNIGNQLNTGSVPGVARAADSIIFVPGVKYGYSTKQNTTTEIGLAGVIGLTSSSPDWGLILQTQFEFGI